MVVPQQQTQDADTAPDNSIITNLKRLERAGSKKSLSTQNLVSVTKETANHVMEIVLKSVGRNVDLPRGYIVQRKRDYDQHNQRYMEQTCLLHNDEALNSDGKVDHTTLMNPGQKWFEFGWAATSRHAALAFANDIASGWLEELAEFLEKRADADGLAVSTLVAARSTLAG